MHSFEEKFYYDTDIKTSVYWVKRYFERSKKDKIPREFVYELIILVE